MSPFAVFFKRLRLHSRLRQHQLAELLGYEQAYVSAIELGQKPPSNEFLARLLRQFDLNDVDQAEMQRAVHESRRRFVLPVEVATETYQLCSELWDKIDRLHPAQIRAIRSLIKLDDEIGYAPRAQITQRSQSQNEEAEM